jgi:hypothetical protein
MGTQHRVLVVDDSDVDLGLACVALEEDVSDALSPRSEP